MENQKEKEVKTSHLSSRFSDNRCEDMWFLSLGSAITVVKICASIVDKKEEITGDLQVLFFFFFPEKWLTFLGF